MRIANIAAAGAAALLLMTGSAVADPPAPAVPSPEPPVPQSVPHVPPPPESLPSPAPAPEPSAPPPAVPAPGSPAPAPWPLSPPDVAEVPGCEPGCEVVFLEHLPDDVQFAGLRTHDPETGVVRSLVAYWAGGDLRGVGEPEEEAYVLDGACGYDGDAQRCAVTFNVGAHGSSVATMLLTYNGGIEVTDRVYGSTPDALVAGLDPSGRPDAAVRQSTYEPAYAGAPTYWETWLEFEGRFVRSGCGPLSAEPAPPPVTALYGSCRFAGAGG
ncbi:hypothetical protein [Pseudonocardia nigra]|uniref:hypothetical protein n=1 Tax=Pseudonocardia nigra TaxID=1921578 RepID=UPI001C6036B7|nr:hypothetical protein [Pseudonocardia nigra]